jgi:enoyl-[acyl-carrier protein] reductase III
LKLITAVKMNVDNIRYFEGKSYWAVVLGGSSGMGLATVKKMAASGMNILTIYREPKLVEKSITAELSNLETQTGVSIRAFNINALLPDEIDHIISELNSLLQPGEKIRLLLHAISRGNLKPLASSENNTTGEYLLSKEDFEITGYAMSVSLVDWSRAIFRAGFFSEDARIIGLTSEGAAKYWPGYTAVAAAKSSLESITRAMAVELAPFGIRTNLIQAGITDTPSLRKIPGSDQLKSFSITRNPFKKLTTAEDVANAVCLLCMDEAAWINGALLHVDGGEHCC